MSSPSWQVPGKTVLITGAARGIGAECARRLASRGMKVSLVGLEPDELQRVAEDCGPDAAWFEADVTDSDQLQAAVDGTVERFGSVDVVIANAGIAMGGPVRLADQAAFERVIEINLFGVYRTVRACLPQIVDNQGYVLIVASAAAIFHSPGMAAYSASKAGVEAFGNALRTEMRHLGVDVGVAYFSWIDTEMVRGADRHPALGGMRAKLPKAIRKTYPVSAVGDAVVEGVDERARVVAVPKAFLRTVMPLRGMLTRVTERNSADGFVQMEKAFQQDIAERGADAASRPVGAGGAAGSRD